MADFVQKAAVKSAVRALTTPIADMATFQALIQDIIDNNPWGCTEYTSGGVAKPALEKSAQRYTGKVIYENAEAKTIGQITVMAQTSAGFATDISTILATAALGTAMGGTASHDSSEDTFSVTLKCHHLNGELFNVKINRDSISLTSYETDSIRTSLETWADAVGILA
ncbi:MAG TPA: hypothetical protein VN372_03405 [Methanospirillum sp.]|nr:hypothetical protein [Methanospirillum sp.]